MTRPPKHRQVLGPPPVVVYKPAGVPTRDLAWVTLTLDEYEAIRQIDHEQQDQETVAEAMGVSRPTVTRIYQSARRKIARVLVRGEALMIEGGPVVRIDADESVFPPERGFGSGRGRGFGRGRGRGFGRGRQTGQGPGDRT
ncbi:MAG: DUF134 domain-containing protein [Phycisphaerae bacterium]|nr:DUF134 domain-containing protein [Phycisphaerae bacterium]